MPDAITPYNFVPLPEAVVPGEAVPPADRYPVAPSDLPPGMDAPRHTGWFSIRLTTKTPTYTRAAQRVAGDDTYPNALATHNEQTADFYHRGDRDAQGNWVRTPVLPGSGLRGMFRSVFEIMSCSYPEFINNRRLFFRSFAEAIGGLGELYKHNFKFDDLVAGQLGRDKDGWYLNISSDPLDPPEGFVAIDSRNVRRGRNYTTQPVSVRLPGRTVTILRGALTLDEGELCSASDPAARAGELINPGKDIKMRHWHQVILTPKAGQCYPCTVPDDVYTDYEAWGDLAHGSRFGTSEAPRKLENGDYCFALLDSSRQNVEVIGANMMMALRYSQSLRDVAAANFQEIKHPRRDMTAALFGRVDEKRPKETIKGRVFFEDAVCRTESPWLSENEADSIKVPDILAGPKPTSVQTYLKQEPGQPLRHWSDDGSGGRPQAEIRGAKRYWHRSPEAARATLVNTIDANKSRQQTKIRPVRENVVFEGRVRFENLTDAELGGLYAAIQLPENLAHKFGMAKNLGLGSLEVEVTETTLLDMVARYRSFDASAGKQSNGLGDSDVDRQAVDDMLRRAYSQFVSRVHAVCPNNGSLWGSERMQAFAALLMFKPQLPVSETRQVEILVKNPPNSEYAHNSDQWGNRNNRLPTARRLTEINRLPLPPADISPVTLVEVVLPDEEPDEELEEPQETEEAADEQNNAISPVVEETTPSVSAVELISALLGEDERSVERNPPSAAEVAALPYYEGEVVIVKVLQAQFQKGEVKIIARYAEDIEKPIPFKDGPTLNDVPIKSAEPGKNIHMVVTRVYQGKIKGLKRP